MMDYTLQLHGEKRVYPVPDGLYELLSDIAREVLREQPVNLVLFIADYLTALIKFRETAKVAIDMVGAVFKKGGEYAQYFQDLGITEEEAIRAATIIQAAFRGFKVRMELRRRLEREREGIFEPTPEELDMINYLAERNLTFLQGTAYAITIQRYFRGYSARKKCDLRTFKALRWVRSHESWRHDWLWKEFGLTTSQLQASLERKPTFVKYPEPTLPQRELEVDRYKLRTLFKGQTTEFKSDSILSLMAPRKDREIIEFKSDFSSDREESEEELMSGEGFQDRIGLPSFKEPIPGYFEEWTGEYGPPPGAFFDGYEVVDEVAADTIAEEPVPTDEVTEPAPTAEPEEAAEEGVQLAEPEAEPAEAPATEEVLAEEVEAPAQEVPAEQAEAVVPEQPVEPEQPAEQVQAPEPEQPDQQVEAAEPAPEEQPKEGEPAEGSGDAGDAPPPAEEQPQEAEPKTE